MINRKAPFPSIEDTIKHPAYPTTIWALEPDKKGVIPAAVGRGGPINISWEIHGRGPIKMIVSPLTLSISISVFPSHSAL